MCGGAHREVVRVGGDVPWEVVSRGLLSNWVSLEWWTLWIWVDMDGCGRTPQGASVCASAVGQVRPASGMSAIPQVRYAVLFRTVS